VEALLFDEAETVLRDSCVPVVDGVCPVEEVEVPDVVNVVCTEDVALEPAAVAEGINVTNEFGRVFIPELVNEHAPARTTSANFSYGIQVFPV
jgi:uncharacterized protein YaiI (UPF0178 family)